MSILITNVPGSGSASPGISKAPTIQKFLTTGSVTGFLFTTGFIGTAASGATYTNNGATFTVLNTVTAGTQLFTSVSSGTPLTSGTLTKVTGTGDSTITFSVATSLATYTAPTSPAPLYITVEMVGAGGGGAAINNPGVAGGDSIFGAAMLVASGGGAGINGGTAGVGGAASLGTGGVGVALSGGAGQGRNDLNNGNGGMGGANSLGGAGAGGSSANGNGGAAAANTGAGGGGGGGTTSPSNASPSPGGGAGGFVQATITSVAASYPYKIGLGGSGGGATGGFANGGNGASGLILVTEYYSSAGTTSGVATTSSSGQITNLGLAASVSGNALTVTLTQADGVTAPTTGTGAVTIGFRDQTSNTSGAYTVQTITSTRTIVTATSGDTLGLVGGGIFQYVWVYAINDAGTIRLALAGSRAFDEGSRQTVLAIGGSATTSTALYGTTSSNSAIRLIGRIQVAMTTAGQYNTAPNQISLNQYDLPAIPTIAALQVTGTATGGAAGAIIKFPTVVYDTTGGYSTSTGRYTATVAGYYYISAYLNSNAQFVSMAFVNGTLIVSVTASTAITGGVGAGMVRLNAGDILDLREGASSGGYGTGCYMSVICLVPTQF